MYELKKRIGKIFTSKYVGTGPLSYEKIFYQAVVSQRLRNTALHRTATQLSASTLHNQSCRYSDVIKSLPHISFWSHLQARPLRSDR